MATETITVAAHPPSLFLDLPPPPVSSAGPFALEAEYKTDSNEHKVNLIIGAYRDDDGRPWSLSSVTEASSLSPPAGESTNTNTTNLARQAKSSLNVVNSLHEYPPLRGDAEFLEGARRLVFGDKLVEQHAQRLSSIQTVSGTGANSLVAKFVQKNARASAIWLPDPTWINHADIWHDNAPGVKVREYPYYNAVTRSFDFDAMMACLECNAREDDVILLHACAHNPTGLDPSKSQWGAIADLCQRKKLFVVFDLAYQGFTSGDLAKDAWAVRFFLDSSPLEFAVCQSFSKNLGLYGERVGALHIVVSRTGPSTGPAVENALIDIHRASVSVAPLFGCRVAVEIFRSRQLQELWAADLVAMSTRIRKMREALYEELVRLETPGNWVHIVRQSGMFSYTGLSPEQVRRLREYDHVYMLPSGRLSVCGLTSANVKYTAQAIHRVVVLSA